MKREFINSKKFEMQWRELGLIDEELYELQDILTDRLEKSLGEKK